MMTELTALFDQSYHHLRKVGRGERGVGRAGGRSGPGERRGRKCGWPCTRWQGAVQLPPRAPRQRAAHTHQPHSSLRVSVGWSPSPAGAEKKGRRMVPLPRMVDAGAPPRRDARAAATRRGRASAWVAG